MMGIDLKERFMKLFKFLSLMLGLWIIGLIIFLSHIPQKEELIEPADVVAILTGGSDRLGEGFKVFNKSGAKWLLISGVGEGVIRSDFNRYFNKYSVDPDKVILGKTAADTPGNAFEAGMFMQLHGLNNMLVVTSRYHIPRSKAIFSLENPGLAISYHGVLSGNYTAKPWRNVSLTILEYNKTIAYIAFHYNKAFAEFAMINLLRLRYW